MSAPRFSSFQPPPSFSSFPEISQPDSGTTSQSAREAKSKSKSGDTHKGDRHAGKRSRSKERSTRRRGNESNTDSNQPRDKDVGNKRHRRRSRSPKPVDEAQSLDVSSHKLFYSDRKGDPLNAAYGGLYARDVPRHHLVDRRRILGLSPIWNVRYRSNKGIEVGNSLHRNGSAMRILTDNASRILLSLPPTRTLAGLSSKRQLSDRNDEAEEISDGFLKLCSTRPRRNLDRPYRDAVSSNGPVGYRSDTGSSSSTSPSDNDSDADNSDSSGVITLSAHQATIKSLEETLATCPFSIATWIDLLLRTLSNIPLDSKNATKTRAEVAVSILSRALDAHPDNARSSVLRLKYVRAGEEIWNEDKCRREWEELLKSAAQHKEGSKAVELSKLWVEWLEWRIRTGNRGLTGLISDHSRAQRALDDVLDNEDRELAKLRLLWKSAILFHGAGFTERAVGVLQAQAELTYHCPHILQSTPLNDRLDSLEEFWESELPRIGEAHAQGWSQWPLAGKPDVPEFPSSSDSTHLPQMAPREDSYSYWATCERFVDSKRRFPIRSMDSQADEDPYATVLFSDLRPFLFEIETSRAKEALKLIFLDFLGLHVQKLDAYIADGDDDADLDDARWCNIHLTSQPYLESLFPRNPSEVRLVAEAQAGVLIGREREYTGSCFGPVKNWGLNVIAPLDLCQQKASSPKTWLWGSPDIAGVANPGHIRHLFEQLRGHGENENWDEYAIAFEASINIKSAIKLSRSFLATDPHSLRRWTMHARLERLRGKVAEARKIYHTALSSSPQGAFVSQAYHDWAEMEWLSGKKDDALRVILTSIGREGDGSTGIALLKARQKLEELTTDALQQGQAEHWIDIRALLELITTKNMELALGVFDRAILAVKAGSSEHERLTISALLMVYHYSAILNNALPPAILRDRVSHAIEQYPSNSIIAGLFLEAEKGQGVWGRVRATLGDSAPNKDLMRRIEEVWIGNWEKGRWEKDRTRGSLAAAVSSDRTKFSPILWRIYLEFEIRAGELQRAKALLYRAIAECPLWKELYLLAFGPLRSVFAPHELNSFADAMAERGLRMRRGIEEVQGEERNVDSSDSEYGEEDIEYNAAELRRLRPY